MTAATDREKLGRHLARRGLRLLGMHAATAEHPTVSVSVAPEPPRPGTRSLTMQVSGAHVASGDWRRVACDVHAQATAALSPPR